MFFDLCHGAAHLIVAARRAMGRTRRELVFRICRLSCRANKAVGMPLLDPKPDIARPGTSRCNNCFSAGWSATSDTLASA